jgi:hypothetical protein
VFTSRAKIGEPHCGGLARVAPEKATHGVTKRILKVKYNEILTIKCNENAGFSGLSAIFTPSRENSYDKVQRDTKRRLRRSPEGNEAPTARAGFGPMTVPGDKNGTPLLYDLNEKRGMCSTIQMQNRLPNALLSDLTRGVSPRLCRGTPGV